MGWFSNLFGGGDTTNITNTGLGDDQFSKLEGNQASLAEQQTATNTNLGTGFDAVTGGQTALGTDMATGFGTLGTGQDTINTNLDTGFSNIGAGQQDLNNQIFGDRSWGDAYEPFKDDWEGAASNALKQMTGQEPMDMAYDVNGDGTVSLSDSREFMKRGAGLVQPSYNDPRTNAYTTGSLVGGITKDFDNTNTKINEGFGGVNTSLNTLNTGVDTLGQGQKDLNKQIFGEGSWGEAYDPFKDDFRGAVDKSAKMIVGLEPMDMSYDVNRDGTIDITDTIQLARRAAGYEQPEHNDPRTDEYTKNSLVSGITGDFDNTNTKIKGVSDSLDTMNTGVNERFDTLNTGLDTRFNTLSSGLGTKFSDLSKGVLEGQTALGGSLDTYYSDLADKQAAQQEALGSLQTGVSGVQSAYDAGERAAVQARTQLADQVTGGFDDTIDKIATTASVADTARDNLATDLGDSIDSVGDTATQQFTDLGTAVEEGNTAQTVDAQQRKIELANKIKGVRELLSTTGDNLTDQAKTNYGQLVDAFDEEGNLIQKSVTDTGTTLDRAIGDNGELVIKEVDENGTVIGTNNLNIDQMLSDAEAYKNTLSTQIGTDTGAVTTALGTGFTDLTKAVGDDTAAVTKAVGVGQTNIGAQITDAFDAQNGTLDTQALSLIDIAKQNTGLDAALTAEFKTVSDAFDTQGNLITKTVDDEGNLITNSINDQGKLITTKFDATGKSLGTITTDVGTVITDAKAYSDSLSTQIGTDTGAVTTAVGTGFTDLTKTVGAGQTDIGTQITNAFDVQAGTLTGQGKQLVDLAAQNKGLDESLTAEFKTVSDAFDTQGNLITDSVDAQGNTVKRQIDAQGTLITTKFDATGTAIGTVSTNVSKVISDAATYQTGTTDAISSMGGDLSSLVGASQTDLTTILNTGFNAQAGTMDAQALKLVGLASSMGGLSTDMQAKFASVAGAFTEQGTLIGTTVDDMGATIKNDLTAQGELVTSKINTETGELIGQTKVNIQEVLAATGTQSDTLSNLINKNYGDTVKRMEGQGDQLFSKLGDMSSQQDTSFDSLGRRMDANLNNVQTSVQDQQGTIQAGFDQQKAQMGGQITDLAKLSSGIADLDMQQRVKFSELGNAFNEQGSLIKHSVDANGNTISRAVDQQGNLILRTFNQQGEAMGSNVINISNALYDLAQVQRRPGANTFGGQLSPAYSADVQPNNVNSGLMSPFAQTRG